jgi:hypothetical protein
MKQTILFSSLGEYALCLLQLSQAQAPADIHIAMQDFYSS